MSRRCRHGNLTTDILREVYDPTHRMVWMRVERCADCGRWLSIGASNDSGCALEIRAAELARLSVERTDAPIAWCGFTEWLGFDGDKYIDDDGYRAGCLAREIAKTIDE